MISNVVLYPQCEQSTIIPTSFISLTTERPNAVKPLSSSWQPPPAALGMLYANSGENFWKVVCRFKFFTFSTAFLLYLYRLFEYRLENVPAYLVGLDSMLWIWGVLGFSHVYLNRDSPILIYLRSAVFPVYILHQPIQYALAFLIFPAEIPAFLKFILLVVGVLIVSFGIYEFLLRRIGFIAPYFGMRYIK